jgi:hypothetical protein
VDSPLQLNKKGCRQQDIEHTHQNKKRNIMNYLDYTRKNIPLGEKGWLANIFGGRNKNTDNWDKKTGSVTIGGKTYSTNDRNDVVALQDYLIDKGYNLGVTKGTGYFGKNT